MTRRRAYKRGEPPTCHLVFEPEPREVTPPATSGFDYWAEITQ